MLYSSSSDDGTEITVFGFEGLVAGNGVEFKKSKLVLKKARIVLIRN